MELHECDEFVKAATRQFERLAVERGYIFERHKKHFWIRHPGRMEVLQGNYQTAWLRGFMHNLEPHDRQRLRLVAPYLSHPCGQRDGWRFRIANEDDVNTVKEIVVARCGK